MKNLIDLTTIAELETFLANTNSRVKLLFKHSNSCPISSAAYDELARYLVSRVDNIPISHGLVIVQTAREVSNNIASRFQVEHQSPQAILLVDNEVTWHCSHRRITNESLQAAIAAASAKLAIAVSQL
jgi:bacillithiol system protein YtxJ